MEQTSISLVQILQFLGTLLDTPVATLSVLFSALLGAYYAAGAAGRHLKNASTCTRVCAELAVMVLTFGVIAVITGAVFVSAGLMSFGR